MAELYPYVLTLKNGYLSVLGQRLVRAEVWLRMVQSGEITIGAAVEGTPSYTAPVEWSARELG